MWTPLPTNHAQCGCLTQPATQLTSQHNIKCGDRAAQRLVCCRASLRSTGSATDGGSGSNSDKPQTSAATAVPRSAAVGAAAVAAALSSAAAACATETTATAAAVAEAAAAGSAMSTAQGAAAQAAAVAAAAAAGTYVPSPVEVGWQIWVGFIAGVVPFIIASYEFGKRVLIQRRCPECQGTGLVKRGKYLKKCRECGGMLPWLGWRYFFLSTATPGNGGPLLQPRGQTSIFYSVPPPLDKQQQQQAVAQQEQQPEGEAGAVQQQQQQQQQGRQ